MSDPSERRSDEPPPLPPPGEPPRPVLEYAVPPEGRRGCIGRFIEPTGPNTARNFWGRAALSFVLSLVCCYAGYAWAQAANNPALSFLPIGGLLLAAIVISTVLKRRGYVAGILFVLLPPIFLGVLLFVILLVLCSGKSIFT